MRKKYTWKKTVAFFFPFSPIFWAFPMYSWMCNFSFCLSTGCGALASDVLGSLCHFSSLQFCMGFCVSLFSHCMFTCCYVRERETLCVSDLTSLKKTILVCNPYVFCKGCCYQWMLSRDKHFPLQRYHLFLHSLFSIRIVMRTLQWLLPAVPGSGTVSF